MFLMNTKDTCAYSNFQRSSYAFAMRLNGIDKCSHTFANNIFDVHALLSATFWTSFVCGCVLSDFVGLCTNNLELSCTFMPSSHNVHRYQRTCTHFISKSLQAPTSTMIKLRICLKFQCSAHWPDRTYFASNQHLVILPPRGPRLNHAL